jgi:hypothetical protein
MEFDNRVLENLSRKLNFHSDVTRIAGTLHEKHYTFFIISLSVLGMRNVSGKCYRENQIIILFLKKLFLKNLAVCEKVEKPCTAEQATDDNNAHAHCVLDN